MLGHSISCYITRCALAICVHMCVLHKELTHDVQTAPCIDPSGVLMLLYTLSRVRASVHIVYSMTISRGRPLRLPVTNMSLWPGLLAPQLVLVHGLHCHDHVSDLRSPISVIRSPIPVSDIDLRPCPSSTRLYIIAIAPHCLFGLGPFGLHQSLYLDTAQTTPSITERSTLRRTLRTLDTIDTLTDPTLPDP
jgi:hypothetical protein